MSKVTTNDEGNLSRGQTLETPISLGCYVAEDTLSSYGNFVADPARQTGFKRSSFLSRWVDRFVRVSFFTALSVFLFLLFAPKDTIEQTSHYVVSKWHAANGAVDLHVRDVVISGAKRATRAQVLSALGAVKNKPIWELDTTKLRQGVETLPWVESAVIERRLPNVLKIHIKERTAFAVWQSSLKESYLIDVDGRVLQKVPNDAPQGLPIFAGKGAQTEAHQINSVLSNYQALSNRVEFFKRVEERRWTLVLKNKKEIWLPARGLIEALDRLQTIETKYKLLSRRIAVVDLRLRDRVTLMRQKTIFSNDYKTAFGDDPDLVTGAVDSVLEQRIWGGKQ